MTHPSEFFIADHRACDTRWGEIEAAFEKGDEAKTRELWESFDTALRRHFSMEEEVLFPAIEQATGMQGGPTQVMRMEHQQMRSVLEQMAGEASSGNFEGVVDHGDTLLMLIQQHNAKEEGILYPMADRALADQWPGIRKALSKY